MRLTERFLASDPPTAEELEAAAAHVRALLPALAVESAIGVAGTVTTVAAIDLGLAAYDPTLIHGHRISRAAVDRVLADLSALPLAERERVPGLEPARAPVIVGGLVVLREVMARYGLAEIEASERDILYGAALAAANPGVRLKPDTGDRRQASAVAGRSRGDDRERRQASACRPGYAARATLARCPPSPSSRSATPPSGSAPAR